MRARILGIIGRLLILSALAVGAVEVYSSFDQNTYHVITASELLSRLSPRGLALLQYTLPPALWSNVLEPVLRFPVWLLLGAPGLLLEYLHDIRRVRRPRSIL
ncbi:MAG TPA: hypothetical protein VEK12_16045 [Alphaproteobacteria bacterium]|nr:hypothetical protein [Alphaproteobacteria bacterium]